MIIITLLLTGEEMLHCTNVRINNYLAVLRCIFFVVRHCKNDGEYVMNTPTAHGRRGDASDLNFRPKTDKWGTPLTCVISVS